MTFSKLFCAALFIIAQYNLAPPDVLNARYGLSDMSPEQYAKFWKDVDIHAYMEVSLNICGKSSDIERRAKAAVQACVTPEALSIVVKYWHRKLQEKRRLPMVVHIDRAKYCASVFTQDIFNKWLATVDKEIDQAKSLCGNCRAIGLCH